MSVLTPHKQVQNKNSVLCNGKIIQHELETNLAKTRSIQIHHNFRKLDQGTWLMPDPQYKLWEEKGSKLGVSDEGSARPALRIRQQGVI